MLRPPSIFPLVERFGRWSLGQRGYRTRLLSTAAGRLHAYDARGEGPLAPIALLHGIASTATAFAPMLARLRRRARRVIAVEYLGHGFSDEPREPLTPEILFESVTEALDRTLEEPTVLFGNSLGGAVALHYAIARPQRVRGLVLVSPAGARVAEEELRTIVSSFDLSSRADALAFLARIYHRVPRYWPLLAHELLEVLGRKAVRDLLASAKVDHGPAEDALAALRMPILLVWGRSERLLPETALAWFRAHLPKHAVIEQPAGFGHSPHLDDPARVARRIETFLRELPRPESTVGM